MILSRCDAKILDDIFETTITLWERYDHLSLPFSAWLPALGQQVNKYRLTPRLPKLVQQPTNDNHLLTASLPASMSLPSPTPRGCA